MATIKMKGIDVSYWQGKPAGSRYKKFKAAGWDFIIARIGYGSAGIRYPDSTFDHNYDMAVKYGLKIGAYFYSNAKTAADGKREGQYVLELLQGRSLNMPVWIDMEDNATSGKASKSSLAAACKAFCETIEEAGYMAGVYASTSWFQSKIGSLGNLRKWVAQYNDRVTYKGSYDMWQYSSTAAVSGFSGRRDVNRSYVEFDKNFLIKPKVNLLLRSGASLVSKKRGTLEKNGIYRVTKTSANGTRGYVWGRGWVTVSEKFVETVDLGQSFPIKTKGRLIVRSGAPLSTPQKTTLKADTQYTVVAVSQDGSRGKVFGKGWITMTDRYVEILL